MRRVADAGTPRRFFVVYSLPRSLAIYRYWYQLADSSPDSPLRVCPPQRGPSKTVVGNVLTELQ